MIHSRQLSLDSFKGVAPRTRDLQALARSLGLSRVQEIRTETRLMAWRSDEDLKARYTIREMIDPELCYEED